MDSRLPTRAGLLVLLAAASASAELRPTGPQMRASDSRPVMVSDTYPRVAADAAGNFVVAWKANAAYNGDFGIEARRYDAAGTPLAPPMEVVPAVSYQPDVAMDAAGDFVVVWGGTAVSGQRYDAAGTPIGSLPVMSSATSAPVAVARAPGGAFVVVWTDAGNVFAQRYDAAGVPEGAAFQTNVTPADDADRPAVAADGFGNFVVAWADDAFPIGPVLARRYDAAGMPQGTELTVTADGSDPALAMNASGAFVAAWTAPGNDIAARRFDAAGVPQGAEFMVNTYTTREQETPAVAMDASGNFLVAWSGDAGSASPNVHANFDISARHFDAAGAPLGPQFLVNTYTTNAQRAVDVAAASDGAFVVTWATQGQFLSSLRRVNDDGQYEEVMVQRYTLDCGDGSVDAGEQCDDGNAADGDGCDHACVVEPCRACSGSPSSCAPVTTCGNGDECCPAGCGAGTDDDCPILAAGRSIEATFKTLYSSESASKFMFVAKDPAIGTGPAIDPATDGLSVHVYGSSGGVLCFELEPAGSATWRTRGDPLDPIFVYTDRDHVNGVCGGARVRSNQIRVKCRLSGNFPPTWNYGTQGSVAVRVRSGDAEYCSVFGGNILLNGGFGPVRGFKARRAPAPSACPDPPLSCP